MNECIGRPFFSGHKSGKLRFYGIILKVWYDDVREEMTIRVTSEHGKQFQYYMVPGWNLFVDIDGNLKEIRE